MSRLAFCLYKYFPYGGLQRDFLRIAETCAKRGHQVTVYTLKWDGNCPDWLDVVVAPPNMVRGGGITGASISGTRKYQKFTTWLHLQLKQKLADVLVGFNKMPGLDIYYCADPCFEHKSRYLRRWWYKYTCRYRHFSHYEQSIFNPGEKAEILMISDVQQALFQRYYGTELSRMTMLPPGISMDRCAPENAKEVRDDFRHEFNLKDDDFLLLQIGSGFRTKGLDRSIRGLASLPPVLQSCTQLFVIGQDDPARYQSLARRLGVDQQVTFFSGRDDVPRFLLGADVLVHPAYAENTGTVLLESIVAGLPALVTDVCGYARYVQEAGSGEVVPSPFVQKAFDCMLHKMLLEDKVKWRENGLNFSKHANIYDMPIKAADIIDQVLERKSLEKSTLEEATLKLDVLKKSTLENTE